MFYLDIFIAEDLDLLSTLLVILITLITVY